MGAVDLYRRRNEATSASVEGDPASMSREALRARLVELEASDLEQTRLISELSRQVEALARAAVTAQDERRRMERMMWIVGVTTAASLVIAILSLARWSS